MMKNKKQWNGSRQQQPQQQKNTETIDVNCVIQIKLDFSLFLCAHRNSSRVPCSTLLNIFSFHFVSVLLCIFSRFIHIFLIKFRYTFDFNCWVSSRWSCVLWFYRYRIQAESERIELVKNRGALCAISLIVQPKWRLVSALSPSPSSTESCKIIET